MICFKLQEHVSDSIILAPRVRYNDRKINKSLLADTVAKSLVSTPLDATINGSAARITDCLVKACDRLLPRQCGSRKARPPWWNTDTTVSRSELNRAHRAMLRNDNPDTRARFRAARNRQVGNIRAAKKAIWSKFVEDQSMCKNPWGRLTKWLIKGKRIQAVPSALRMPDGSYTSSLGDTVSYMLDELIPTSNTDIRPDLVPRVTGPFPQVSADELRAVIMRQKNKEPGADGPTARIIKAAWPAIDQKMYLLTNKCLKEGRFPDPWKNAAIVVLLKGKGKDPLVPKSYRPVSLLPVLGKILEEVICDILETEIGPNLSPRHHGFRLGKSTTTALTELQTWVDQSDGHVLGTFLDISGAFDNVQWPMLIQDMRHLNCGLTTTSMALDYLTNRTATYRVDGVERTKTLTRGCPQGSKLGPRLWNLTMDRLLKVKLPNDTTIVAYADDIALLVSGNTRKDILKTTEEALVIIAEWGQRRGLAFSKEKSVMIPLKGGLVPVFTAA
ncbi:unnamed protein product [Macrosiphum euphorbiae]|nr:unnamed protein product [Macrosiphum euphorbiae]